jgi:hypothetical protein
MFCAIKRYWAYLCVVTYILIVIIYVTVRGENIYIQVHDNLDSAIAWFKMMQDYDLFFKHDVNVPFLGGISRNYLRSELKAYTWLYILFPAFKAYVFAYLLKIIISVTGAIYLAKVVLKNEFGKYKNIAAFCGFLYALLPNYPESAFSFASIPVLLAILYQVYYTGQVKYYIGLFFYTMFSNLPFHGIFICGYFFAFFVFNLFTYKKVNIKLLVALVILCLGYIITDYRLMLLTFYDHIPTVRESFKLFTNAGTDIVSVLQDIKGAFLEGYYHAGDLHYYVVFPVCLLYFIVSNTKNVIKKNYRNLYLDKFNWLFFCIVFNSIVFGLDGYEPFRMIIKTFLPPFKTIQFSRILWLNPFLWYFSFSIVIYRIIKYRYNKIAYGILIMSLIAIIYNDSVYNDLHHNLVREINIFLGRPISNNLTYKEFYSEDLFAKIKQDIGYSGEWSIAFGMHPAVLEYNKIATLDGYLSYYPLSYKKQFLSLIAPDFKHDIRSKNYFKIFSGRAYIYSDQIAYTPLRKMNVFRADMDVDPDILVKMKCCYVFSRVEINNMKALNLKYMGCWQSSDSPYAIFVYKTNTI